MKKIANYILTKTWPEFDQWGLWYHKAKALTNDRPPGALREIRHDPSRNAIREKPSWLTNAPPLELSGGGPRFGGRKPFAAGKRGKPLTTRILIQENQIQGLQLLDVEPFRSCNCSVTNHLPEHKSGMATRTYKCETAEPLVAGKAKALHNSTERMPRDGIIQAADCSAYSCYHISEQGHRNTKSFHNAESHRHTRIRKKNVLHTERSWQEVGNEARSDIGNTSENHLPRIRKAINLHFRDFVYPQKRLVTLKFFVFSEGGYRFSDTS
jgi:hypothetical protein